MPRLFHIHDPDTAPRIAFCLDLLASQQVSQLRRESRQIEA